MKKLVMLLLLVFAGAVVLQAQESSVKKERVEISAGLGYGWLLNSNLSPYGLHYRGNYKGGITGSVDAFYCFDGWKAGVLFSNLSTSGNYTVEGNMVAEDITVNYIAPQLKADKHFAERWTLSVAIGAGYLWYANKGWQNTTEYKVTAHALGVNGRLEIAYRLLPRLDIFGALSYWGAYNIKKFKVESQGESATSDLDDPYQLKFNTSELMCGIRAVF